MTLKYGCFGINKFKFLYIEKLTNSLMYPEALEGYLKPNTTMTPEEFANKWIKELQAAGFNKNQMLDVLRITREKFNYMKFQDKRKSDLEKIALGKCVSPLTADRCPYCVDTCDASHWKNTVNNMLEELGIKTTNKK